jgi:hypothetical protein
MLGVAYALFLIERVLYSFLLTETMATFMGISLLGGMIWPRANRWGAAASLGAAFGANFLLYYWRGERLDHWDPNVFLTALAAGVLALVAVSLLTRPEPAEKISSFFSRLQTPTELAGPAADPLPAVAPNGERLADLTPSQSAAEAGQQSLLVNLLDWRRAAFGLSFFRAYRVDLMGFSVGWALVLLLVGLTWLIFRL